MAKEKVANPEKAEAKETTSELNLGGFFNETKEELAKVVWPSRQQLISESVAVILMVILVATIIYLVDNVFHWLAGMVFR